MTNIVLRTFLFSVAFAPLYQVQKLLVLIIALCLELCWNFFGDQSAMR